MTAGARLPARALLAVALLAAATRTLFELQTRGGDGPVAVQSAHLLGDERAYDAQARDFADGALARTRSFYQEPLYAFTVGLAYRLADLPPLPPQADRAVTPLAPVHTGIFAVQHLLGVLTCVLVALLGARAVSPRVGLLAGLLAALSGPLVFAESMLLKEGPALLLWTASLHLWLDVLQDKGLRRAALLGALLGLGVLLRGNTYLLLAAVLGSLLLLRVGGRRRPRAAGLVLGCALLALSPATIHNLRRGELVLSTYQAGSNAAIGMPDDERPWAGVVYEPLQSGHGDALFEEDDAVALAEAAEGRRLTGPEVSRFWWRRTLDVVLRRPTTALQRAWRKLAYVLHPDEVPDVKDWAFVRRAVPLLDTPLSDLTLWGPLALLGLLCLPWRGAGPLVLRASLGVVAGSLLLFYVMGRYRLAVAPAAWILAAGALDAGWRRVAAARGWRRGATLAALLLLLALPLTLLLGLSGRFDPRQRAPAARTAGLPALGAEALAFLRDQGARVLGWLAPGGVAPVIRPDIGGLQVSWANLASIEMFRATRAGNPAEARARRDAAVEAAREALRLAPLYPEGRAILVRALDLRVPGLEPRTAEADAEAVRLLLVVEGERAGALVHKLLDRPVPEQLESAAFLRGRPSLPERDAFVSSALAFAARRVAQFLRDEATLPFALQLVEEALRRAPQDHEAEVQHGLVLKRLGRLPEAEAAYRRALDSGVRTVELLNNLGNLLIQAGRHAEALPLLEQAVQLDPDNDLLRRNLEKARSGG